MSATAFAHSLVVQLFVASLSSVLSPEFESAAPLSPLMNSCPAAPEEGCVAPNNAPPYSKRCHFWRVSEPTMRKYSPTDAADHDEPSLDFRVVPTVVLVATS